MVDVKTVARPQLPSYTRQSTVKRIAQPVQPQENDHADQCIFVARRQRVAGPCTDLCRQPQPGKMVRVDASWCPRGQSQENAFFSCCQPTLLYSPHLAAPCWFLVTPCARSR